MGHCFMPSGRRNYGVDYEGLFKGDGSQIQAAPSHDMRLALGRLDAWVEKVFTPFDFSARAPLIERRG